MNEYAPLVNSHTKSKALNGLERFEAAFEAFRRAYPAFASTRKLDELRATEYSRLDRYGHVYLDYTGGGLYAESQLREHMALLNSHVFGNPHSHNLPSLAMTHPALP